MYVCTNNCAVGYFLFQPEYVQELRAFETLMLDETIAVRDIASGISVGFFDGRVTKRWGNQRVGVPDYVRREAQTFVDSRVPGIVVCPTCAENAKWRKHQDTTVTS